MPKSYMPSRESDLLTWVNNLNTKVAAGPEGYGLTIEQAGSLAAAVAAFATAYQTANGSDTRSPANIEVKNTAKDAMIVLVRALVKICQAWPEMTDDKRALLGITVPDTDPTPVPIPTSAPKVSVASVSGRLFDVELRKDDSPSRSKPTGVRAAWIYTAFGEEQPTTFEVFNFRGEARKTDTQIVMPPSVAPGTKVWVAACWVNAAGKPGPVSMPIATWTTHGMMENNAA